MAPVQLGPYLIGEPLGQGGMGTVYTATHQQTGDIVAIKVLSRLGANEPSLRQRFAQEIETLKKLHHPNIVQLHGHGEEDGTLFFVMERVEGESLHQRLKSLGPCSWQEAIEITLDICKALKHAHDRGIIHRDLKPANLLMDKEGTVKLTDFGIARLFGSQHLTADHSVIGTADYMAPEQVEGKQPTIHSDLYSLGSVIYALMTGKPPFSSKVAAQVIHKLRYNDPQPLIQIRQDIPIEFDRIVMQLLHKTPAARIPTAVALGHRLQAMFHALGPTSLEEDSLPVDPKRDTDQRESSGSGSIGNKPTKEGAYTGMEEAVDDRELATEATIAAPVQVDIPVPPPVTHYTEVDPSQKSAARLPSRIPHLLQVLILLVAGIGVALATWYMLQPPTADQLIERIDVAAEAASRGSRASTLHAREDIELFLSLYPDHEQTQRLRQLERQLREVESERQPARQE